MSEYNCGMIQDLLPLYADGVCSAESREAVEAHLCRCKTCKALYENMTAPEKLGNTSDQAETFLADIGKKLFWIVALLVGMIGCCAANAGPGWHGWEASFLSLCVTLAYIIIVTLFMVIARHYRPLARLSLILSIVTFLGAVCNVIHQFGHSSVTTIFSLMSVPFVSIPFYGFRYWFDWTGSYIIASVIALLWLTCSILIWRKHRRKN